MKRLESLEGCVDVLRVSHEIAAFWKDLYGHWNV